MQESDVEAIRNIEGQGKQQYVIFVEASDRQNSQE